MATLFFEGFDKGIIFNQLDPNYWSTQFKQYPKYAFGGYLPRLIADSAAQANQYVYNSPNGGILPSGKFFVGSNSLAGLNPYPGIGSPPGFIAFSNIEVEDINTVEYPTYLQASGFSLPSGNATYLNMRCLGLESKHTGYSDYPHRHTLFSYNSGDVPQLTVNIVKITGTNNFVPINTKYETLALEIQQNNNTIGYFDLNITQSLTNYRIASIYNSNNTILTVAHTLSDGGDIRIMSRWTHLEFSIDESQDEPTLFVNAEDINLPVVNFNNEILKEDWELGLPISGFKFDNLRFYNRTYSSSISQGVGNSAFNYYYMLGKNWLLDDLVLIDNTGLEPTYWLGSTARVTQLVPGAVFYGAGGFGNSESVGYNSLIDNSYKSDGIRDWSTNSSVIVGYSFSNPIRQLSHRKALSFLDGDINSIEAINSGAIDAVIFNPRTAFGADFNGQADYDRSSLWRETLNEAVGGVKLYNNARKKFLDTKFVNVFRSGIGDPLEDSVSLLLHGDTSPIVDSTKNPKGVGNNNVLVKGDNTKFGDGSLYFTDNNSYLSVTHSDLANNPFTIECWVYFKNHDQIVSLFDRKGNNPDNCLTKYGFYASTTGVLFYRTGNCDKLLLFNSGAPTGVWNHIAVVRTSGDALRCFLNGVANTKYNIRNCYGRPCQGEPISPIEVQGTVNGTYSLNFLNDKNLTSVDYLQYQGINQVGIITPLKIGQPKSLSTDDEYFNNVSLLLTAKKDSILDLSSNPKTITNNGVIFSYDQSRFEDKSLYFTGGKNLLLNYNEDFNFGTGDFTIEFWYYLNNITSNKAYYLFNSNNLTLRLVSNGLYMDGWVTDTRTSNTGYMFKTSNGSYGLGLQTNVLSLSLNTWYYVSIVKYAGDLFVYNIPINQTYTPFYGWPIYVLKNESVINPYTGQFSTYNNFPITNSNGFTIGDVTLDNSLTHNLYIDNFRITKGIARTPTRLLAPVSAPKEPFGTRLRTEEENLDNGAYIDEYRITYGLNRYTSNFMPPTQPFKSERDDYYPVGPEYSVNRTVYRTFQHYALKNPATNQNWTINEINNLILGVKKL